MAANAAFTNKGLTAFRGLAAGQADIAPSVTLSTAKTGAFSETITLAAAGSNASAYSGALPAETLTITGTITSPRASPALQGAALFSGQANIAANVGSNSLPHSEVIAGGTVTLVPGDYVTSLLLSAATVLTLNGMALLTVTGSSAADTIIAGGIDQTLTGGGGADTLVGYKGGLDVFRDTAAGLNGDTISGFLASDKIDVTDMGFGGAALTAAAIGGNTAVTVTSGATQTSFTLTGGFSQSGFTLASDGNGGTIITHS